MWQIYDEYGMEGLEAFERSEISKQTVGMPKSRPAEVRLIQNRTSPKTSCSTKWGLKMIFGFGKGSFATVGTGGTSGFVAPGAMYGYVSARFVRSIDQSTLLFASLNPLPGRPAVLSSFTPPLLRSLLTRSYSWVLCDILGCGSRACIHFFTSCSFLLPLFLTSNFFSTFRFVSLRFVLVFFFFQVRRLLDNLLREAAQKRQDVALGTFGGMTAECTCLPVVDIKGRLVKRNLLPEVG